MRKLDNKFHLAGEQIVKTSNGEPIPEDEPVFIVRARDRLARWLLWFYHVLCIIDRCTSYQMRLLRETRHDFAHFRRKQPDRMKQPGCTMGR